MDDVKRYRPPFMFSTQRPGGMEDRTDGDYVTYDDYAALRARLQAVEKERDDAVIKRAAWELESKMARAEVARICYISLGGMDMTDSTDNPLEPCPFCGGVAHIYQTSQDSDTQVQAQCKGCGAEIAFWLPWTAGSGQKAAAWADVIKRWNTRPALAALSPTGGNDE